MNFGQNKSSIVVGSIMPPPKASMSLFLKSVNVTLYGKRNTANVNKDLDIGRSSWIIRVDPLKS